MRLSEAILLGSSIVSPCRGTREQYDAPEAVGCALEMALEAAGRKGAKWQESKRVWKWLLEKSPSKFGHEWYLQIAINFDRWVMGPAAHMNLEQFIDWVRSIEPSEPEEFSQMVDVLKEEKVEVL